MFQEFRARCRLRSSGHEFVLKFSQLHARRLARVKKTSLVRVERTTFAFGGRRSIQLSYKDTQSFPTTRAMAHARKSLKIVTLVP